MQKTYNPFRCKFSKAPINDQLKVIKKLAKPTTTLSQLISQLMSVDPAITIRQNGQINLLTDKNLFA
jgi:hypothetical protein